MLLTRKAIFSRSQRSARLFSGVALPLVALGIGRACAGNPRPASAPERGEEAPNAAAPEVAAAPPPANPLPAITHRLPANEQTVQWGWLDPKEPPKLTISSGDVVAVETLMHARDQIQKGTTMEQIVALRKANPGGGPHSVTGPIYVNGAEPGDMLEILQPCASAAP